MEELWLVTVPNNKESPEFVYSSLQSYVGALGKLYKFEIPALTVGTLDSLLALSDDLIKINSQVEV
jgi:V-type H+-transporting ATPase subunit C